IGIPDVDIVASFAIDAEQQLASILIRNILKTDPVTLHHINYRIRLLADDLYIFETDTCRFLDIKTLVCLQHHILQLDIFYMHFGDSSDEDGFVRAIAIDMADMKIPEDRCCFIYGLEFNLWQFSFFTG